MLCIETNILLVIRCVIFVAYRIVIYYSVTKDRHADEKSLYIGRCRSRYVVCMHCKKFAFTIYEWQNIKFRFKLCLFVGWWIAFWDGTQNCCVCYIPRIISEKGGYDVYFVCLPQEVKGSSIEICILPNEIRMSSQKWVSIWGYCGRQFMHIIYRYVGITLSFFCVVDGKHLYWISAITLYVHVMD